MIVNGGTLNLVTRSSTITQADADAAADTLGATHGLGASVAVNVAGNETRTEILPDTSLQGVATGLFLGADANHGVFANAKAGALGGSAASPSVAVNIGKQNQNLTVARINPGKPGERLEVVRNLNLPGEVQLDVDQRLNVAAEADAGVQGNAMRLGAGVAINALPTSVEGLMAYDTSAAGPVVVDVNSSDQHRAEATSSVEGSQVATHPEADRIYRDTLNEFGGPLLTETIDSQIGRAQFNMTGLSEEKLADQDVSAAVAVNLIQSDTNAEYGPETTIISGADIIARTFADTDAIAFADSQLTNNDLVIGTVGAGVAFNNVKVNNSARVGSGAELQAAGRILISAGQPADDSHTASAEAIEGKGSLSDQKGGAFAINTIDLLTVVEIGSSAKLSGDAAITLATQNTQKMQAFSGGNRSSLTTGRGSSISANLVAMNTTTRTQWGVTLESDGPIDVTADAGLGPILSRTSEATSAGISGAYSELGNASVSSVGMTTLSTLGEQNRVNPTSVRNSDQTLTVRARDEVTLSGSSGQASSGVLAGVGGTADVGILSKRTEAWVDEDSEIFLGGTMMVDAQGHERFVSNVGLLSASLAFNAIGSASAYAPTLVTRAWLGEEIRVTTLEHVHVNARDDVDARQEAGAIGAGGGAGVSGSATLFVLDQTTESFIAADAVINAQGRTGTITIPRKADALFDGLAATEQIKGVAVTAAATQSIESAANGAAIAAGIAGSGSLVTTAVTTRTRAHVEPGAVIRTVGISSDPEVVVRATDSTTTTNFTGQFGGSAVLGVGVGISTIEVDKTTEAFVAHDTQITSDSHVRIDARSVEDINSDSASVGFAGIAGLEGAVGIGAGQITTRAYLGDDPHDRITPAGRTTVDADGNVVIDAYDNFEVDLKSGTVVGSIYGSAGTAVAVQTVDKTIEAFVGPGTDVNGYGLKGTSLVPSGTTTRTPTPEPPLRTGDDNDPAEAVSGQGEVYSPRPRTLDLDGDGTADVSPQSHPGFYSDIVLTPDLRNSAGIHVAANSISDVEILAVSAAGAGALAVSGGVPVLASDVSTLAWIGEGSNINRGATGAGSSDSDVEVIANNVMQHLGIGGQVSGAAIGIGGSADVSLLKSDAAAWIEAGAHVEAARDVTVEARNVQYIDSYTAGLSGGLVGLAGSVGVVDLQANTVAVIGDDPTDAVTSTGNTRVLAANKVLVSSSSSTDAFVFAGAFSAGFAGGTAGVGVNLIQKDTSAAIASGAIVDARALGTQTMDVLDGETQLRTRTAQGVAVQSVSYENVGSGTVAGAGGAVGLAGGVVATLIDADVSAVVGAAATINGGNTAAGQQAGPTQSVNVAAGNKVELRAAVAGIGAGVAAAAGAINVGTLQNNVVAVIEDQSRVFAAGDVNVDAVSNEKISSFGLSAAGGVAGLGASVSVYSIGAAFDSTFSDEQSNPRIADALRGDRNDGSGQTVTATGYAGEQAQANTDQAIGQLSSLLNPGPGIIAQRIGSATNRQHLVLKAERRLGSSVTALLENGSTAPGISARIDEGARVNADGDLRVNSDSFLDVGLFMGAVTGGVAAGGASVSVVNVNRQNTARVDGRIEIDGNLEIRANLSQKIDAKSLGAAGGVVGLGASVVSIHDASTQSAVLGSDAQIVDAFDVLVQAGTNQDIQSFTGQISGGAGAAGGSISVLETDGSTIARIDGSEIGAGTNPAVNSVSVIAAPRIGLHSHAVALAGGIATATANVAVAALGNTVTATIADSSRIRTDGDLTVRSDALLNPVAIAEGVDLGAIAVGASVARATLDPVVTTTIGSAAVTAGNDVVVESLINDRLLQFEASSAVDSSADSIAFPGHGLVTGDQVVYTHDLASSSITGLADGGIYFVIRDSDQNVGLARSLPDALADIRIDLDASLATTDRHFLSQLSYTRANAARGGLVTGNGVDAASLTRMTVTTALGGGDANVSADGRIVVRASVDEQSKSVARGITAGVAGVGVVLGDATAAGQVQTSLRAGRGYASGDGVFIQSNVKPRAEVLAQGAAGGVAAGLGVHATSRVDEQVTAAIQPGANVGTTGDVDVTTFMNGLVHSDTDTLSFGVVSVGAALADADFTSSSTAAVHGPITSSRSVVVQSAADIDAAADAEAASGGVVDGNGGRAIVHVEPALIATVDSIVNSEGDVRDLTDFEGNADSRAVPNAGAAASFGATHAESILATDQRALLEGKATIRTPGSVTVQSSHNFDDSGPVSDASGIGHGAKSRVAATAVSAVGGNRNAAASRVDSVLQATLQSGSRIEADGDVRLGTRSSEQAVADSRVLNLGVGVGSIGSNHAAAIVNGTNHVIQEGVITGLRQLPDGVVPGASSVTLESLVSRTANGVSDAAGATVGLVAGVGGDAEARGLGSERVAALNDITATGDITVRGLVESNVDARANGIQVALTAFGSNAATAESTSTTHVAIGDRNAQSSPVVTTTDQGNITIEARREAFTPGFVDQTTATGHAASGGVITGAGSTLRTLEQSELSADVFGGSTLRVDGDLSVLSLADLKGAVEDQSYSANIVGGSKSIVDANHAPEVSSTLAGTIDEVTDVVVHAMLQTVVDAKGQGGSGSAAGGVGVVAAITSEPVANARIETDVDAAGDIQVIAAGVNTAETTAEAVSGSLIVSVGASQATTRLVETMSATLKDGSTLNARGGDVRILAGNWTGTSLTSGRSLATAEAGSGAYSVLSGGTAAQSRVDYLPQIKAETGSESSITADQDVRIQALADGRTFTKSTSPGEGLALANVSLVAGGDHGAVTHSGGAIQARVRDAASIQAGNDLLVSAVQGGTASSFVSLRTIGVVAGGTSGVGQTLVDTTVSADLQSLASPDGTASIVAGRDINVLSDSQSTVASHVESIGGSILRFGQARSESTRRLTVDAVVGGPGGLKAGRDIAVDARNNISTSERPFNTQGSLTAASTFVAVSSIVGVSNAEAINHSSDRTRALVIGGSSLEAGESIEVRGRSFDSSNATSTSFAHVGVNAIHSIAQVTIDTSTTALTGSATGAGHTTLVAGQDVTFDADAVFNGATTAESAASGSLVGVGVSTSEIVFTNFDTKATTGAGTEITAGRDVLFRANSEKSGSAIAKGVHSALWIINVPYRYISGIKVASPTSIQVIAALGPNSVIQAGNKFSQRPHDPFDFSSQTLVELPDGFDGTIDAESLVDVTTVVAATIAEGVRITAPASEIIADYDGARTAATTRVTGESFSGKVHGTAENRKDVQARVQADPSAHVATDQLNVVAFIPRYEPNGYLRTIETPDGTLSQTIRQHVGTNSVTSVTNAVESGVPGLPHIVTEPQQVDVVVPISLGPHQEYLGSELIENVIEFPAVLSPAAGQSNAQAKRPTLFIDGTGMIVELQGMSVSDGFQPMAVGDRIRSGQIVVESSALPDPQTVQLRAPLGTIVEQPRNGLDDGLAGISITNHSNNDLLLDGLQLFSEANGAVITRVIESSEPANADASGPANSALIDVLNTGRGDIVLRGELLNPLGTTRLQQTGGGDIRRDEHGSITTRLLEIETTTGELGSNDNPVPVSFVESAGTVSGIERAITGGSLHLNVRGVGSASSQPVSIVLNDIQSRSGDVDIELSDGVVAEPTTLTRVVLNDNSMLDGQLRELTSGLNGVSIQDDFVTFEFTHGLNPGDVLEITGEDLGLTGSRSKLVRVIPVGSRAAAFGESIDVESQLDDLRDEFEVPAGHYFVNGQEVVYRTGGNAAPAGLEDGQRYFVRVISPTRFKLASSPYQAAREAQSFQPWNAVNGTADTIRIDGGHGFQAGQPVVYHSNGGSGIGGLVVGQTYFAVPVDTFRFRLAAEQLDAIDPNPVTIDLDPVVATGSTHSFGRPFDSTSSVVVDEQLGSFIDFHSEHGFATGNAVIYHMDGTSPVGGLVDGEIYFVRVLDATRIELTRSLAAAQSDNPADQIALTPAAEPGGTHSFGRVIDPVPGADEGNNTIHFKTAHGFTNGQPVTYRVDGTPLPGLVEGATYFAIVLDPHTIKLAATAEQAMQSEPDSISFSNGDATGAHSFGTEGIVFDSTGVSGTHQVLLDLDLVAVNINQSHLTVGGEIAVNINQSHRGTVPGVLPVTVDRSHRLSANSIYLQTSAGVSRLLLSDIETTESHAEVSTAPHGSMFELGSISQPSGDLRIQAAGSMATATSITATDTVSVLIGLLRVDAGLGDVTSTEKGALIGQALSIAGNRIGSPSTPLTIDGLGGRVDVSSLSDVMIRERDGDLRVGNWAATSGNLVAESGGAIVDHDDDPEPDLTAGHITLLAGSIGTAANPIEVQAGPASLSAAASGDIHVTQFAGDLRVTSVESSSGGISLTTLSGDILVHRVVASVGRVGLHAAGSIVDANDDLAAEVVARELDLVALAGSIGSAANRFDVDTDSAAGGAVNAEAETAIWLSETEGAIRLRRLISAAGNIDVTVPDKAGPGQDLFIAEHGHVEASHGHITLSTGDNMTVSESALLVADHGIALQLDLDDQDAGVGASAWISGDFNGPVAATAVLTGPDQDTVIVRNLRSQLADADLLVRTGGDNDDITVTTSHSIGFVIDGGAPVDRDRLRIQFTGSVDLGCSPGGGIETRSTTAAGQSRAVVWENIEELLPLMPAAESRTARIQGDRFGAMAAADELFILGADVDSWAGGDADGVNEFWFVCDLLPAIPVSGVRFLAISTGEDTDRVTIDPYADNTSQGHWDIAIDADLGSGDDRLLYGNTVMLGDADPNADGSVDGVSEHLVLAASATPGAGQLAAAGVVTISFQSVESIEINASDGSAGDSDTFTVRGTSGDDRVVVDVPQSQSAAMPLLTLDTSGLRQLSVARVSNLDSLAVLTEAGSDSIAVLPGEMSVFVDGGDPKGSGDELRVLNPLATLIAGPQVDEGTWNSPGSRAVTFDHIEDTSSVGFGDVTGRVWHDRNGNGQVDEGEEPLNGRVVQLLDLAGNVIATATSGDLDRDHDGRIEPGSETAWFVFSNVPEGTWRVREQPLAGWLPRQSTDPASSRTAFILDRDLNLIVSGSDAFNWGGLNERWVRDSVTRQYYYLLPDGQLFRWDNRSGGATGRPLRGSRIAVLTNDYHLDLSLLVEAVGQRYWIDTQRNVETSSGALGLFQAVTISGQVFGDANSNGRIDGAEFGSNGRQVEIHDQFGRLVASLTTADLDRNRDQQINPRLESGWYSAPGLRPGDYTVRLVSEASPSGATADDVTARSLDAAFNLRFSGNYSTNFGDRQEKWMRATVDGTLAWTFIVPDGRVFHWDGDSTAPVNGRLIGELSPRFYADPALLHDSRPAINPESVDYFSGREQLADLTFVEAGSVQGRVWHDRNGNGQIDEGEEPLNDRVIHLRGLDGSIIATATSGDLDQDGDGQIDPRTESAWFVFPNVPAGTWQISEQSEPGWLPRQVTDVASSRTAHQLDRDLNLTFSGDASFNWGGANEKWLRDSVTRQFYFILPDGEFYRWDNSSGQPLGSPLAGALIATLNGDYHADLSLLADAAARSYWVDVSPAATVDHLALGLFQPTSLSGQAFRDENMNGVMDETDSRINGREIQVLDQAGRLVATAVSQNVDLNQDGIIDPLTESGWYSIEGIRPGEYLIEQVLSENEQPATAIAKPEDVMAAAIDRAFDLRFAGGYSFNWGGRQEKWIRATMDGVDRWAFILADGSVYVWDDQPVTSDRPLRGVLIGVLPAQYYSDPSLLHDATIPVNPTGFSFFSHLDQTAHLGAGDSLSEPLLAGGEFDDFFSGDGLFDILGQS